MGVMVIGAYRPKEGKDDELLKLVREHVPLLRDLGFATPRPALVMRSSEGVIVEVFEWASQNKIDDAHENVQVAHMWKAFADVCTYESLRNLPETEGQFAHFTPINV